MTTEQQLYLTTLLKGCSLEIGRLSLCCINNHHPRQKELKYQVHCDNWNMQFSQFYDDAETAVDKFTLLKNSLYKVENDGTLRTT